MKSESSVMIERMILILLIAVTAVCGTAARAAVETVVGPGPDSEAAAPIPAVPQTAAEKLNAAQLVALVEIENVALADPAAAAADPRRRMTRYTMVATARVVEVFKGAVGGETIEVEFIKSEIPERPPLISLSPGERCVLYLNHIEATGRFTTLLPTVGKEPASAAVEAKMREIAGTTPGERGRVTATLDAQTTETFTPGSVAVTLTINNSSRGEFLTYANLAAAAIFTATGPDGAALEPKPAPGAAQGGADRALLLPPGHFLGAVIELSDRFDFSKPGLYRIGARVPTPSAGAGIGAPLLAANSISILIGQK